MSKEKIDQGEIFSETFGGKLREKIDAVKRLEDEKNQVEYQKNLELANNWIINNFIPNIKKELEELANKGDWRLYKKYAGGFLKKDIEKLDGFKKLKEFCEELGVELSIYVYSTMQYREEDRESRAKNEPEGSHPIEEEENISIIIDIK